MIAVTLALSTIAAIAVAAYVSIAPGCRVTHLIEPSARTSLSPRFEPALQLVSPMDHGSPTPLATRPRVCHLGAAAQLAARAARGGHGRSRVSVLVARQQVARVSRQRKLFQIDANGGQHKHSATRRARVAAHGA
jgi:hypothetical protein